MIAPPSLKYDEKLFLILAIMSVTLKVVNHQRMFLMAGLFGGVILVTKLDQSPSVRAVACTSKKITKNVFGPGIMLRKKRLLVGNTSKESARFRGKFCVIHGFFLVTVENIQRREYDETDLRGVGS